MKINSVSTPVASDPQLAKSLEAIIKQLEADHTKRIANRSQQASRLQQIAVQMNDDGEVAARQLERIMQGNDLTDVNYLAIGMRRARSVARIAIRQNRRSLGLATGFLVAPGVLMTNHHVFESAEMVKESLVQFQYERDASGMDLEAVEFGLRVDPAPILYKSLDVAIVAVEPISSSRRALQDFGWLKLSSTPGKAFVGEYLTIIQHPNGQRKQICVRENKLLKYDDATPFIWYQTDTVTGSSGSPTFNTSWDVVALHHKSIPRTRKVNGQDKWVTKDDQIWTPDMDDDQVDWIANQGVRISKILEYLQQSWPNHPLAQAILSSDEPPTPPHESLSIDNDPPGGIRVVKDRDGNTKIMVLVELDLAMKINFGTEYLNATSRMLPGAAPKQDGAIDVAGGPSARADEKVEIDTTNYAERNGYQSDFLGDGLKVPLPKVVGTKFGKVLKVKGNSTELKYWNYSVVMNADRGLAFFSAANIMPKKRRGSQDGNKFIRDDRVDAVDEEAQIGNEFYKKQSSFEADNRGKNPFDQGHLCRREDLQWGKDDEEAKRNGDDSYHYTNCAPQHYAFNQVRDISGLWNRLEVSALEHLSSGNKICVINGPVFDAPESDFGDDGMPLLRLNGARKKDQTFGGVAIPKLYFKLIAYRKGSELRAKAFVVSQENVLNAVKRLKDSEASTLSDEELSLYQVEIKDLEKLTGLKFGIPAAADTPHDVEMSLPGGVRPIYSEEGLFQ